MKIMILFETCIYILEQRESDSMIGFKENYFKLHNGNKF